MAKRPAAILAISAALFGCDSFPGPALRNEFPTAVNATIQYGDGTVHSGTWSSCQAVFVGASEAGRFGMRQKENVDIDRIAIEVENRVEIDLDKNEIDELLKRERQEGGHRFWVLDGSGIHFSADDECSLAQTKR